MRPLPFALSREQPVQPRDDRSLPPTGRRISRNLSSLSITIMDSFLLRCGSNTRLGESLIYTTGENCQGSTKSLKSRRGLHAAAWSPSGSPDPPGRRRVCGICGKGRRAWKNSVATWRLEEGSPSGVGERRLASGREVRGPSLSSGASASIGGNESSKPCLVETVAQGRLERSEFQ